MMMMSIPRLDVTAALAVMVLLAAPATAGSHDSLEMTMPHATIAGDGSLSGRLTALAMLGAFAAPSQVEFTLAAESLRVEMDNANPALFVGPVLILPAPQTSNRSFQEATLASVDRQPSHVLDVFPATDLPLDFELDSYCTTVKGEAPEYVEAEPKILLTRPPYRRDTSESSSLELCGDSAGLTIRGDMLLTLWGWNASVVDASGTHAIHTGKHHSENAELDQASHAYVWAENATLTFTRINEPPHHLLVEDLHGHVEGVVSAADAYTDLMEGAFDPSHWEIHGDISLAFSGLGRSAIHASLTGDFSDVRIDGRSVALPAPAPSAEAGWPWIIGGVAALLAAIVVWGGHRRGVLPTSAEHIPRLQDYAFGLVERGRRGPWTRGMLALVMRRDPWSGIAVSFLAACHMGRGRLERALVLGRTAHEKLRGTHMVPENAARCARAASGLGQDDEASHWLGLVHELDYSRVQHMIDSNDVRAAIVLRVLRSRVPQAYA